MLVVFVVTAAVATAVLEEEHRACLDQQHSGREGQAVVAAVVVVEDLPISDLDDSSNLDCICYLKDHNYSAVVGFAVEGVYYKCLQHKLQVAH